MSYQLRELNRSKLTNCDWRVCEQGDVMVAIERWENEGGQATAPSDTLTIFPAISTTTGSLKKMKTNDHTSPATAILTRNAQ